MVLRKLTLAEWFLMYQLKKIKQKGFHLPLAMAVDVTGLKNEFDRRGEKFPSVAVVLKALGHCVDEHPALGRTLFQTFFGPRFVETTPVRVNLPIEIKHGDRLVMTAIAIENPQLKSVKELYSEIRTAKSQPLSKYPITQFVYTKKNHWLNRLMLRGLFSFLLRSPKAFAKKGGGITLTSLSHLGESDWHFRATGYGLNGVTVSMTECERRGSNWFLHFGIGFDHFCHTGSEVGRMLKHLDHLLSRSVNHHLFFSDMPGQPETLHRPLDLQ